MLTEVRIVENLDEEFNKITGQDIIVGSNKLLAYIVKKNCLILVKPPDSTTARSASFGKVLLRDVHQICGPLKIEKLFIMKRELDKLSVGRPKNSLNNKKLLGDLFKEENIKIYVLKDKIKIEDPSTIKLLLNDYHLLPTSGHAGINKMITNIKAKYFWTGMQEDITKYVKNCTVCQRNKHINKKKQPMMITTTSSSSFEKIFVDLVGPLTETVNGYKYILTIQDELTKFIENVPLRNKEAENVAKGLVNEFILKYGIPNKITSDQGTEFMNKVFESICTMLKIEQTFSTAYHHESIGALENT
jgi:Integrase zinc binding domain/Integrase core domain